MNSFFQFFPKLFYKSSRFGFPPLKHQHCACGAMDVAIAIAFLLVLANTGHILKLWETEEGVLPLPLAHKWRLSHYYSASSIHWGGPWALGIAGESEKWPQYRSQRVVCVHKISLQIGFAKKTKFENVSWAEYWLKPRRCWVSLLSL